MFHGSFTNTYNGSSERRITEVDGGLIIYADYEVKDQNGNIIYAPDVVLPLLNWGINRVNNKTELLLTSTQYIEDIQDYNLYYTTDYSQTTNYKELHTVGYSNNQYTLNIPNSSTGSVMYYFILEHVPTGQAVFSKKEINYETINSEFDSKVVPQLSWSFDRRGDTIIMTSQDFSSLEEISEYTLYYTTDISALEDYKKLDTFSIGSLYDTTSNVTSYFYSMSFNNYNSNSVTYYFVLEHTQSGNTEYSTLNIDFESLNRQFDNQLNEDLKNNRYIWRSFFKWCS